jgi:hypothetical protein
LLREKGLVVQISCGTSQCTEPGMVLRLAKLVESHVGELRSSAEGSIRKDAPVKTPAGTEGKP